MSGKKHQATDVLVIGAGARGGGGGVAARRLSQAGLTVRILEQGHWPDRGAFRGAEDDWELTYRKQWSADPCVRQRPEDYPINSDDADITPLMFNGVGGGTIIYNGTWPRMLPSDFRTRSLDGIGDDWPVSYNDLKPFYDRSDRDFGVSGLGGDPFFPDEIDYPLPPLPLGKAGRKLAEGHNKLGWHWWVEPNAILSRPYEGRHPCVQRGTCTSGCGEGAKASTDLTHFPHAIRNGAELVTGARVVRIEHDENGLATGAVYLTGDGVEHFARASIIVVAANAIGTPRLLLMSASNRFPDGLANHSGLVGKRLMMHTFSVVTGYFEESLGTWQGHFGASITSYEFYETDPQRGFARGAKWALSPVGGPLGHVLPQRAGQAVWGNAHHDHMLERFGRGASWAIFGEDLPEDTNTVTLDPLLTDSSGLPAPKVDYTLSKNSIDLTHFHVERAAESMQVAGAKTVTRDMLLPHSGWHLMGTARMGDDPTASVVDKWSRSHDVPNLFVVDASQFVTSSGVNPTSTIAALALRAADRIVSHRSEIPVPS